MSCTRKTSPNCCYLSGVLPVDEPEHLIFGALENNMEVAYLCEGSILQHIAMPAIAYRILEVMPWVAQETNCQGSAVQVWQPYDGVIFEDIFVCPDFILVYALPAIQVIENKKEF